MAKVNFLEGTQLQYNNLATKDPSTLYFITDTEKIYKGSVNVTNDIIYVATNDQLPEAADAIEGKLYLVLATFEILVKSANAWVIFNPGYLTDGADWASADSNKFATIGLIKKGIADAISNITTEVSYDKDTGSVTVNGVSTSLTGLVSGVTYDASALTITISSVGNAAPQIINLPKDNFVKSGRYEAAHDLPGGGQGPAIILVVGEGSNENEVVIPAASLVDIYTAENTGKDITVTITDDNKVSANAVINPVSYNALVSDAQGLLVKLYSNDAALAGNKILVSDATGKTVAETAYSIKVKGTEAEGMGTADDVIPTAALIASAISTAVSASQGTLQQALNDLTSRVDTIRSDLDGVMNKLIGNGDADKVVISTTDGIIRSNKVIGGSSLDNDSTTRITKLATEEAVYDAMSWSII